MLGGKGRDWAGCTEKGSGAPEIREGCVLRRCWYGWVTLLLLIVPAIVPELLQADKRRTVVCCNPAPCDMLFPAAVAAAVALSALGGPPFGPKVDNRRVTSQSV